MIRSHLCAWPARLPLQFAALLILAALLTGCGQLDIAVGPLLYDVVVLPDAISPNADGVQDVTEIHYSLRRTANVSIYFENEAGDRFYFRQERRRSPGDYSVFWGGAVEEPRTVETDYGTQEILSWVLPDGAYTWVIEGVEESGDSSRVTGPITLSDADTEVPELHNFAVVPQTFTPNQDSIEDFVNISYYLTKEVANVLLYLIDPAEPDVRYYINEAPGLVKPTEKGYHEYRYEADVDRNAGPPPDGDYTLIGEARDAAGNAVRVERTLTISEGGKPRAEVAQGEIQWEGEMNRVVTMMLNEKLCFKTFVTNVGTVPIRTSGPWPGQEYLFTQNYNTLAATIDPSYGQQTGAWRFGINFDTTGVDFPFRWAIGRQEDLELRIIDGKEQWYLLPGTTGEVSGCIQVDQEPPLGTRFWEGGLIHQGVAVVNNAVDRISVEVGIP
jgi:hypothetical protein